MENNSFSYKGYNILVRRDCPNDYAYITDEIFITCSFSGVNKVKQYIDDIIQPIEFRKKLEELLDV